jgi:hypothetical protein
VKAVAQDDDIACLDRHFLFIEQEDDLAAEVAVVDRGRAMEAQAGWSRFGLGLSMVSHDGKP